MRELTPEEQAKLELLTDPDATKTKFSWDEAFQKKLLGMLLSDHYMLVQSLDKIKPLYFSSEVHVTICKILFDYFLKHNSIPEKFILHQELIDALKDREKSIQLYYTAEFYGLYEYYVPGLETRDYLLDKITYFAKVQALKVAFHNSLIKMNEAPEEEKTWTYVYEEMRKAMIVERHYETGLEYFLNIEKMFADMQTRYEGLERFTSAFHTIDNSLTGGGLFPGQIGAWIGLPGTGKSLALVKGAVANVLLGHKVLYITMEMDELGIGQRFTSQFSKVDIKLLSQNKKRIIDTIEEFGKDKEDKNQLIIKQFPGGQMDVNAIRAYCSKLELRGWKPNMIILDYVGEMKHNPNLEKHESAYAIIRDLRAFGVEKRHCTLTALQPNRTAAKLEIGQYIDESNIGTSFDQFKPLDAFWSLNQHVQEKDAEVGRVFIIKHRDGSSRLAFKIGFDFSMGTLDIFEISKERYQSAMTNVAEKRREETIYDNYNKETKNKKKKNLILEPDDDE